MFTAQETSAHLASATANVSTDDPIGTSANINLPARVTWLADILVVAAAFFGTFASLPAIRAFFLPGGFLAPVVISLGVPLSAGSVAEQPAFLPTLGLAAVSVLPTLATIFLLGGYRPLLDQSRARVLLSSVLGPIGGLGATTMVLVALRSQGFSRLFLFAFAGTQAVLLPTWRLLVRAYKVRRLEAGHYARGVVFVGTPSHLRWLAKHFSRRVPPHAYHIIGALPIADDSSEVTAGDLPMPVLGGVDRLGDLLIHRPIHDVVVLQPAQDSTWLRDVIKACDYFRVTVRIVPETVLGAGLRDLRAERNVDPMGLPALTLSAGRSDVQSRFFKRFIDVLGSFFLLLLLSPVLMAIAIAIKVTTPKQSVFYRWRVVGYKGRPFVGYKFTTMQADADAQKAALDHLNEMQGPAFKIKNDPRVTPLGRILRKYSLNELPQLWSVLRGDMSLVGPRPPLEHELERFEYWHKRKLSVKPGITCLWQVQGRNAISDFDDWVRLDLQYIDTWSHWLDIKILARTVGAVFKGTGS